MAAVLRSKNTTRSSITELKYLLEIGTEMPIISLVENRISSTKTLYFLDTKNLDFFKNGIILRTRLHNSNADTVIKLRQGLRTQSILDLLNSEKMELEIDRTAGENISSAKMRNKLKLSKASKFIIKENAKKLFNKPQRSLLKNIFKGLPKNTFKKILFWGPIYSQSWQISLENFDSQVTIESWQLPSGVTRYEISIRVKSDLAASYDLELLTILKSLGPLEFEKSTKTEWALKSLSGQF